MKTDCIETELLITLNSVRGIGAVLFQRLMFFFGSLKSIACAREKDLQRIPGIGQIIAADMVRAFKTNAGQQEKELARKNDTAIITYLEDTYPAQLRTTANFPLAIYVKGKIQPEDECAIAVIGSRKATYYGKSTAERFGYALAQHNICVVSGLARGIDTCAHQGALNAKGRTIAVLGSGLLRIYPEENAGLADKISRNGALISELPMNTPPDPRNFPQRNRIVSALSYGILIIEAPLKSGALITTEWALEQGKEVFAVPGKIDSDASKGCHAMIKQGAKLTESVDDIVEELAPRFAKFCRFSDVNSGLKKQPGKADLTEHEGLILSLLDSDSMHIDEIIRASNLPAQTASAALLGLELKKLARQLHGNNYVRVFSK